MSKNITIQEGGVGRQFTADKLKTALVGGGSCNWVPEDEVGLSTLSVTENGTYSASDEGSYGYSQVNVNVPGGAGGSPGGVGSSIIGVDPTTGNENLVTVDEDGNIVATEVPSSIRVETLPAVVDYADGDTIDFTGLVVKAYKKNGEVWTDEQHPNGVIPISELVFPVTQADDSKAHTDEYTDGNGVIALLIIYLPHWDVNWEGKDYLVYADTTKILGYRNEDAVYLKGFNTAELYVTSYDGEVYAYLIQGDSGFDFTCYDPSKEQYRFYNGGNTSYHTTQGAWTRGTWKEFFTEIPESTSNPLNAGQLSPVNAYQEIPVQWEYISGDMLETSFRINVIPSN